MRAENLLYIGILNEDLKKKKNQTARSESYGDMSIPDPPKFLTLNLTSGI